MFPQESQGAPLRKITTKNLRLELAGGTPTPLKNMKAVGMMTFPIYGKKSCSKPPTR